MPGMNVNLIACDGCGDEFEQHGSRLHRRGMSGLNLCPACRKRANESYDPDIEYDAAKDEGRFRRRR